MKQRQVRLLLYEVKLDGTIEKYRTTSIHRFWRRIARINWQDGLLKVYVRVSYPKRQFNDGDYYDHDSLILAVKAFLEEV